MRVLMVEPKGGSKSHIHNKIPEACPGALRRAHTRRLGGKREDRKGIIEAGGGGVPRVSWFIHWFSFNINSVF